MNISVNWRIDGIFVLIASYRTILSESLCFIKRSGSTIISGANLNITNDELKKKLNDTIQQSITKRDNQRKYTSFEDLSASLSSDKNCTGCSFCFGAGAFPVISFFFTCILPNSTNSSPSTYTDVLHRTEAVNLSNDVDEPHLPFFRIHHPPNYQRFDWLFWI